MSTVKIALCYPFTRKGSMAGFDHSTVMEEIEMRRPTILDLKGLNFQDQAQNAKSMTTLISRLTGLTISEVENLDFKDWLKFQSRIEGMISK